MRFVLKLYTGEIYRSADPLGTLGFRQQFSRFRLTQNNAFYLTEISSIFQVNTIQLIPYQPLK